MKKLLLTLALLLTLVLAFSACDGGETPNNQEHTHAFGGWITVKEPTDIEEGKKVRVCSCGEQETQVIPTKQNVVTKLAFATEIIYERAHARVRKH